MKKTDFSLHEKITMLRVRRGLSQEELAEKAKIPHRTYQNIEYKKTKKISAETLKNLAHALHVPESELLDSTETAPSKGDLVLSIISLLPSLNERELGGILSLANAAPSLHSGRNIKTGG